MRSCSRFCSRGRHRVTLADTRRHPKFPAGGIALEGGGQPADQGSADEPSRRAIRGSIMRQIVAGMFCLLLVLQSGSASAAVALGSAGVSAGSPAVALHQVRRVPYIKFTAARYPSDCRRTTGTRHATHAWYQNL